MNLNIMFIIISVFHTMFHDVSIILADILAGLVPLNARRPVSPPAATARPRTTARPKSATGNGLHHLGGGS